MQIHPEIKNPHFTAAISEFNKVGQMKPTIVYRSK